MEVEVRKVAAAVFRERLERAPESTRLITSEIMAEDWHLAEESLQLGARGNEYLVEFGAIAYAEEDAVVHAFIEIVFVVGTRTGVHGQRGEEIDTSLDTRAHVPAQVESGVLPRERAVVPVNSQERCSLRILISQLLPDFASACELREMLISHIDVPFPTPSGSCAAPVRGSPTSGARVTLVICAQSIGCWGRPPASTGARMPNRFCPYGLFAGSLHRKL